VSCAPGARQICEMSPGGPWRPIVVGENRDRWARSGRGASWVGVVASRGLEGDVYLVDRAAPPSYPLAPRERGEGQGEGPHFTRPGPRIARYFIEVTRRVP